MDTKNFTELTNRSRRSTAQLEKLAGELERSAAFQNCATLCVYATGSYGRLEARTGSDLDAFLLDTSKGDTSGLTRLAQIKAQAAVVDAAEKLEFPPFDNDGEFLKVHSLKVLLTNIGKPEDDYQNDFTARMLLVLESRPIYGRAAHDDALKSVLATYYRDHPDHTPGFKPLFFVNDILRYWRTLCLNYEVRRHQTGPARTPKDKTKDAVKLLKLKFHRVWTCFSLVLPLAARMGDDVDQALDLVKASPFDRLSRLANGPAGTNIHQLLTLYNWYLQTTRDRTLAELVEEDNSHQDMLAKANEFVGEVFKSAKALGDNGLQHLVV